MSEALATCVLLTPVPVDRVRRGLESIEAAFAGRFGFERARDPLLRALMDEFDSRWLDARLTWTARHASDDHPEATFVALAGHSRVGDARAEIELLAYPWLTEPASASIKLRLSAAALQGVYGFQPPTAARRRLDGEEGRRWPRADDSGSVRFRRIRPEDRGRRAGAGATGTASSVATRTETRIVANGAAARRTEGRSRFAR